MKTYSCYIYFNEGNSSFKITLQAEDYWTAVAMVEAQYGSNHDRLMEEW